jgi:hypothetical protein
MKRTTLCLLAALSVLVVSSSAKLPCNGTMNTHAVYISPPVLQSTVPNGKRYLAGNLATNDTFYVVHLYGTPYDQGFAYGSLFKTEIPVGLKAFTDWIGSQLEAQLPFLPPALANILAEFGYEVAMDVSIDWFFNFDCSQISLKLPLHWNTVDVE